MGYQWHFGVVWDNLPFLLAGLEDTVALTVVSMGFGLTLGLAIALIRLKFPRVRPAIVIYVETFRTTPLLVQLIWIYDVLPAIGLRFDPFWSAILALTLNLGAYLSEIFRAGITSIPMGQTHAGLALGMSTAQVARVIVLPQAVRRIIPPLASMWVGLFKDTSLASAIAVAELSYRANVLAVQTYRPVEILTVVAAIYFVLTYPQARLTYWISNLVRVRE
jgi:His/Glu/Gln/Arg/opine family amino acid ABC transporter permease subunit